MVNHHAQAINKEECHEQCKIDPQCNFWDFGYDGHDQYRRSYCRLRSTSGELHPADGYSFGPKDCVMGNVYPFMQNNQLI